MLKNKTRSKRKIFGNLTIIILLLIASFLYAASRYKHAHFNDAQIDEILFYLMHGMGDGQTSSIIEAIQDNLFLWAIVFFLMLLPVIDFYRNRININLDLSFLGRKRNIYLNPSRIPIKYKLGYAIIVLLVSIWLVMSSFGVVGYVRSLSDTGTFFEENYVDPKKSTIIFPEKKRNLIFVYLESMENTILSKQSGGQSEHSLIPELEQMALDPENVSFSHQQDQLGGPMPTYGTTWTVGALTAYAAGLPLKPDVLGQSRNTYGKYTKFLAGSHMLGDVLQKQGYNQSFVMGSAATFGGRDKLYSQHGGYKLIDHEYAGKNELIPPDYKVWWGYEDKKLFEFSKAEITRLSEKEEPFNVQMLTVDTHFTDGWLDPTCDTPHEKRYDNVYTCSSKQVNDFINWVKEQPFYENTTVVVVGDHVGMQQSYYEQMIKSPDYIRTTYNVFINPAIKPAINEKGRLFSVFDFYPTTLAAMGVTIPKNQLALGVNLFSDQPTLIENLGNSQAFHNELVKRSSFYNKKIVVGED